jgi:hypothetical protein
VAYDAYHQVSWRRTSAQIIAHPGAILLVVYKYVSLNVRVTDTHDSGTWKSRTHCYLVSLAAPIKTKAWFNHSQRDPNTSTHTSDNKGSKKSTAIVRGGGDRESKHAYQIIKHDAKYILNITHNIPV